ncbi:hypothetical protein PR202_gb20995 [Eleusine coracana subsp. coracana]|uniref:Uncharacterized protein n=1 Tax=Eleusine coracana subsp. coracana TaxID=191504 RepID=A0AAV5FBZ2_ELECO|nr:hypothetical protein PR202_gb20995 [Eleusine coracana subsp. coracana]
MTMVTLVAGNYTSSMLMTFMVRQLVIDPATVRHGPSLQENEEIEINKGKGDALTWEDLAKMKFTWRVALETLRTVPTLFSNFRRAMQDIDYDGTDTAVPKDGRFKNQSSVAVRPCSFVAFGGGPRICTGMEFASIETLVTMHHLVRRFRWKLCCMENTFVRDPLPSPLHGLPIESKDRGSPISM